MSKIILCLVFTFLSYTSWSQRSFDILIHSSQPTLLLASAGEEPTLIGSNLVLGGAPSGLGGSEPYIYQWLPTDNLDNSTISNPIYLGNSSTEYTLLITDIRGCQASDTIQILILGQEKHLNENELEVFPNPSSVSLRIVAPEKLNLNETTLSVYNAVGKVIITSNWIVDKKEFLLDVSNLAKGNYTLILNDLNSTVSKQIIIQ
jgi:hypothetical protein